MFARRDGHSPMFDELMDDGRVVESSPPRLGVLFMLPGSLLGAIAWACVAWLWQRGFDGTSRGSVRLPIGPNLAFDAVGGFMVGVPMSGVLAMGRPERDVATWLAVPCTGAAAYLGETIFLATYNVGTRAPLATYVDAAIGLPTIVIHNLSYAPSMQAPTALVASVVMLVSTAIRRS